MADRFALYLPNLAGGGAQRVALNLAAGFLRHGFEIDIVAAAASGPLLQEIPEGCRLINLGAGGALRSLPRLVRYIRSERPKAMLSNMAHCNVVALTARRLSGVDMRLVVRQASMWAYQAHRPPSFNESAVLFLMKRYYRKADLVIANSADTAAALIELGVTEKGHIKVIYNPIVSEGIIEKQKERVDHPWFGGGRPPVILSMGRLHKIKDFGTLIRAFRIIRQDMDARLVILGEGPEKERLMETAAQLGVDKDIDLPGFVNNPHAYLARSSVFALSSIWEGFGNVLVEALAAGIPVVSTRCPGGPEEILENGKYGKLVPVGDADTLAGAIAGTLDDPPHKSILINRSWDFSIDKIAGKYIEILEAE